MRLATMGFPPCLVRPRLVLVLIAIMDWLDTEKQAARGHYALPHYRKGPVPRDLGRRGQVLSRHHAPPRSDQLRYGLAGAPVTSSQVGFPFNVHQYVR